MITASIIIVPALGALICFFAASATSAKALLLIGSLLHLGLVAFAWNNPTLFQTSEWIAVDPLGLIFLTIISILFFAAATHSLAYLRQGQLTNHSPEDKRRLFRSSEQLYCGCLLLFLAAMTLVTVAQHYGIIWVALEATTIVSAPLICYHLRKRSLEATWKYLLVCSVGVTLGLLGTFFLAASLAAGESAKSMMTVATLLQNADNLDILWIKLAFIFIFVGFGTKMGLAPFHFWLPDAHSEAPSPVSALLSGALLNCAFLAILRVYQVLLAVGHGAFAEQLFFAFGLISLVFATVFIVRQRDYKRMLAYSSVEHMGILALGLGIGSPAAVFAVMLHAINHSVTKGMLFLLSGNLLRIFGTKAINEVRGAGTVAPVTATLWVIGFLAITGVPPFGIFLSKFLILRAAFEAGSTTVGVMFLVLVAIVFFAMASIIIQMVQGRPSIHNEPRSELTKEHLGEIYPALLLLILVVMLGVHLPRSLLDALTAAAQLIGG